MMGTYPFCMWMHSHGTDVSKMCIYYTFYDIFVQTLPEVPGFQLHFDTSDPLNFNPVQEVSEPPHRQISLLSEMMTTTHIPPTFSLTLTWV